MRSNQKQTIEQAKFTYSALGKTFEKQTKMIEEQERKHIDAVTIQNERLSIKMIIKIIIKKIFEEIVKERFDEIKELTNEINQNGLTCYFKGNPATKRFDDFNNGIELFK